MTANIERLPGQTGTLAINGVAIPLDPSRDTAEDVAKRAAGLGVRLEVYQEGGLVLRPNFYPIAIVVSPKAPRERLETRMTTAAEIQESYEIYRERVCQLIDRPFETVPGVLFLLRDQYTRVQVTARLLSVYDGCHGRLREIEAYTEAMSQLLRLNQPFGA